jgi:recombination protein RecT
MANDKKGGPPPTQQPPTRKALPAQAGGNDDPRYGNVRGLLQRCSGELARALPKHLTADRFLRVVLTQIRRSIGKKTSLLDCTQESLMAAIVQCAQLGLQPDEVLGEAYLIPRWNKWIRGHEVQFMPGYKGLVALAYRSGIVVGIEARAVYAKDEFRYRWGTKPMLHHVRSTEQDPGQLTHAYCMVRLRGETASKFEVLPRWEIEEHRNRSASKDDGPWVTDYAAMAIKTACRVAMKLTPLSTDVQRAVALDELQEAGVDQGLVAAIGDGLQGLSVGSATSPRLEAPRDPFDRVTDLSQQRTVDVKGEEVSTTAAEEAPGPHAVPDATVEDDTTEPDPGPSVESIYAAAERLGYSKDEVRLMCVAADLHLARSAEDRRRAIEVIESKPPKGQKE